MILNLRKKMEARRRALDQIKGITKHAGPASIENIVENCSRN